MKNLAFVSMLMLCSSPIYAQNKAEIDSEMEKAVSRYWMPDKALDALRSDPRTVESKIFLLHEKSNPDFSSKNLINIKNELDEIARNSISGVDGYKRVSCGEIVCEIVIAVPEIDGRSEKAQSIIKYFYDTTLKPNANFKALTPSMVLEGSNTDKGFTLLQYVKSL